MDERDKKMIQEKLTVRNQLLPIIQTSVCVLVIIAAVILKAIGGDIYANVASWYFDYLGNSVFTDGKELFFPPKDNTQVTEISNLSPETENSHIDESIDEFNEK